MCRGILVAALLLFFCAIPAFAGSPVCSGEAGQNLPKPIADNATATSVAFVGETGQVVSIVVSVNLTHTFAADVDMQLRSPDGTIIELTTDNGGGTDFDGSITFDDTAANSIVGASGLLSGTFRPEQPLSTFAGERMSGQWQLQVADDGSGDTGTLTAWSINYCYIPGAEEGEPEGLPEGEPPAVCSGESGQNLPKPISDNTTATSVAAVGETGQVVSIVVSVNLSHTFAGDVDMQLRSPEGTIIELTTDNGGNTDFDGNITFDDAAANSIVGASGVLTGTFRPEQPLSTFAGERMSGQWQLQVTDDGSGDTGTLTGWSISYCYIPGVEEGEPEGLPEGTPDPFCSGEGGQNLPKPIADNSTATSVAFVGETGQVVSIVVSVNLSHTFASDVDMQLRSPDGTIIELTTDNGGSTGFDGNITFDDTAANSIVGVSPLVSGTFRPEQPLSTFTGERMSGQWQLQVADDGAGETGTLTGWSMNYCYIPGAEEGEPEGLPEGEPAPFCSGEPGLTGAIDIVSFNNFSVTIIVGEQGNIASISPSISLTHENFADLDITLESPAGTIIELSTDNGNGLAAGPTIAFSDGASTAITAAGGSVSGTYLPEQALATFAGEPVDGIWILRVEDNASPGTGTFNGWSMGYCYTAPAEGEGSSEGEGEGESGVQSADQNGDFVISLNELLRIVQLYNALALHCAGNPNDTEDGFVIGTGDNQTCEPHDTDFAPQDWLISLSELLRAVQFYNTLGYHYCPQSGSEDLLCPGL
jgi:subtilisin-like proprotein convertase family protein